MAHIDPPKRIKEDDGMDTYRTRGQRTAEARTNELLRTIVDGGPLADAYLATQARREWAMAAVRPTVARRTTSRDLAAAGRWLGTRLGAIGQRLQGAHPVGRAIGSRAAAAEPGTAS